MRREIAMTQAMAMIEDELTEFSAAEEFLDFFGIRYDQEVIHVNRLHILKRWHQYLERDRSHIETLSEDPARDRYRSLLQRAYDDFVVSDAATEKVFKVFQDAEGPRFSFAKLSATLPSRTKSS